MKKQIIRSALLVAAFCVFLCACASSVEGEESFQLDFSETDGTYDLNGFEFLLKYYSYVSLSDESLLSFQPGSEFYDLALQRIHDIENEYNCHITTENTGRGDLNGSGFPTIVMANLYFSDAVLTCDWVLRSNLEAELFEPLSGVSDIIDYTDSRKWGAENYLEWVVWKGDLYGVLPMLWPEYYMTSFGHLFVFNEDFAKILGQPDPREFVEDRSWSREKLGEMMTAYTVTEGDKETKALVAYPGHFFDQALRSNNAQVYKYINGEYVSGYHTPEGQDALKWANDFLHISHPDSVLLGMYDEENFQNFIDRKAAMLLTYSAYAYGSNASLSYEIDDYCILPFPNGPERANDEYTGVLESVRNTLMFPLFGHDVTASALICDTLFEPLGDYDEEGLKDYYLRFFFHDERDYNVFFEIARNAHYSYYSNGFRADIIEKMLTSAASVTELLEATKDYHDELVKEHVVPTVSTMSEVFG